MRTQGSGDRLCKAMGNESAHYMQSVFTHVQYHNVPRTISWQYLVLRDILPYLAWQASPWLPHSTPMSVHVTQRRPGREGGREGRSKRGHITISMN